MHKWNLEIVAHLENGLVDAKTLCINLFEQKTCSICPTWFGGYNGLIPSSRRLSDVYVELIYLYTTLVNGGYMAFK